MLLRSVVSCRLSFLRWFSQQKGQWHWEKRILRRSLLRSGRKRDTAGSPQDEADWEQSTGEVPIQSRRIWGAEHATGMAAGKGEPRYWERKDGRQAGETGGDWVLEPAYYKRPEREEAMAQKKFCEGKQASQGSVEPKPGSNNNKASNNHLSRGMQRWWMAGELG